MSFQAMAWAIKQKPRSWRAKFVLLVIANYANDSGSAWPSVKRLMEDCGVGRNTILRAVQDLEADGMLTVERRQIDGTNLSNLYTLNIMEGVVPQGDRGSPREGRGVVPERDHNLSIEPINEPIPPIVPQDRFEEFWEVYDKKAGRADAEKAWQKSLKRGNNPDELIEAARKYRASIKDQSFQKHASGWLNGNRHKDEILESGKRTVGDIMKGIYEENG